MPKALIVGTGLGGLTAALRLASRGYEVEMVERYHQAGGRLNQLRKDGFTWDLGPSFFSMSYEFHEFIDYCGIPMPFEFVELDPLYAVNFRGSGRNFLIYKDLKKLAREFEGIEPDFERKAEKFLAETGKLFHDTMDRIVRRNFNSYLAYFVSMATVPPQHAPKMLRSVWSELSRHFESREVKEILSLVAFFLGATPFNTPAVYTLLSYTELKHDGYYNVRGGMYKIVEGLLRHLDQKGVNIQYITDITGFISSGRRIESLLDSKDNGYKADSYLINADAALFRTRFFIGNNFKDYAGKIFTNEIGLDQPYYYVNTLSRFNPESAPEGCETLFILCPVPHLQFKPDWSDRDKVVEAILSDLSARIGTDIRPSIVSKTVLDPADWESAFGLYQGSRLGLAHDLNQIGAFRPVNHDEQFRNVFYTGASTIPCTGLPMTVISSRLAIERIHKQNGTVY